MKSTHSTTEMRHVLTFIWDYDKPVLLNDNKCIAEVWIVSLDIQPWQAPSTTQDLHNSSIDDVFLIQYSTN